MEKSIYTIELIKQAILDDTRAYLMHENIQVDAVESEAEGKACVTVGIVIEGLSYSFTCEVDAIQTTFEVALKMLHAQLVLYAIECLKAKTKVNIPKAYVPVMQRTFIKQSPEQAVEEFGNMANVINSFNIFEGSYFEKKLPKGKKK